MHHKGAGILPSSNILPTVQQGRLKRTAAVLQKLLKLLLLPLREQDLYLETNGSTSCGLSVNLDYGNLPKVPSILSPGS